MNNIQTLFKVWAEKNPTQIIQLLNKNNEAVAALYLDKLQVAINNIVICETKTDEKYYLYLNGIAIFFSNYRKIEK